MILDSLQALQTLDNAVANMQLNRVEHAHLINCVAIIRAGLQAANNGGSDATQRDAESAAQADR